MGKYKKGAKIISLDELVQTPLVWWEVYEGHHKVYHFGWVMSWQIQMAMRYIKAGTLYKAIPKEE